MNEKRKPKTSGLLVAHWVEALHELHLSPVAKILSALLEERDDLEAELWECQEAENG